MHVHVHCGDGEVKFWLEPEIEHVGNYGLSRLQLKQIEKIIERRCDELKNAWRKYFAD